jgi:bifunctional non-homologous end joining protein LigD
MRPIKPMLATLHDAPFDDPNWVFEIKWDGFRAIADCANSKVELYSRNLISFNDRFGPIVKALQKAKLNAVLDGEVVVVDDKGKSHFQLLQNYQQTGEGNIIYYVFDILFWKGNDLRKLPLIERKKILKKILPRNARIKYSDHHPKEGKKFFKVAQTQNLEGILAKDIHSLYRTNQRSREWLKIKISMQQEAVIGGFTEPRGSRKNLGALVLGVYERGKLVYIGHTGGGFNEKNLGIIYDKLRKLKTNISPFSTKFKTNAPVTWVLPKLVCEIKFEEWTGDGHMRQPIFLGMRPDKDPKEVRKEIPNDK